MYERIERIKKRVIVDHYPICIEKYRITADVLEHSKHDPAMVQRGKMLKAYAERMPIAIADDELIVGLGASKPMGLEIDPNYGIWTQDEIDSLIEDGYIMDEQDQKDLQELNKNHDPATQIGMQGDIFYEQEDERILKLLKAGLADGLQFFLAHRIGLFFCHLKCQCRVTVSQGVDCLKCHNYGTVVTELVDGFCIGKAKLFLAFLCLLDQCQCTIFQDFGIVYQKKHKARSKAKTTLCITAAYATSLRFIFPRRKNQTCL